MKVVNKVNFLNFNCIQELTLNNYQQIVSVSSLVFADSGSFTL